jgi:hypothetical protein
MNNRAPKLRSPARGGARNRADRSSFARYTNTRNSAATAIDFDRINRAALARIGAVLSRLLPGGRAVGAEWLVLNPRRADAHLGSFKVRVSGARAGCWADFATQNRGGDLVSLIAYLDNVSQCEAARRLACMVCIECGGRR